MGLAIKESKNEEGTVASFGGIEIDTEKMIIRLPHKKLLKAQQLVQTTMNQTSLLLQELQQIMGYLNFIATVVPLGDTFLRRLYNMQLHFPTERTHFRRRISIDAHKNLRWWSRVLARAPERSIQKQTRSTISMWSDAAGTKGLGAFYIDNNFNLTHPYNDKPYPQSSSIHTGPSLGSAFSITLPTSVTHAREHINTKEMRAVEQALLHWGHKWKGKRVIVPVENRAVFHALENRTIRGNSIEVLRRCLLLATEYDLEIEARWISTKENALGDALSRFDYDPITNLAPQLIFPTCSLRNHGFLTYNTQGSHQ